MTGNSMQVSGPHYPSEQPPGPASKGVCRLAGRFTARPRRWWHAPPGLAGLLPSPPGCHLAGRHSLAAAGFARGPVTKRHGSPAGHRPPIRIIDANLITSVAACGTPNLVIWMRLRAWPDG